MRTETTAETTTGTTDSTSVPTTTSLAYCKSSIHLDQSVPSLTLQQAIAISGSTMPLLPHSTPTRTMLRICAPLPSSLSPLSLLQRKGSSTIR
jgi:hypothetical protein